MEDAGDTISCPLCEFTSTAANKLIQHFRIHREIFIDCFCPICRRSFATLNGLFTHVSTHARKGCLDHAALYYLLPLTHKNSKIKKLGYEALTKYVVQWVV